MLWKGIFYSNIHITDISHIKTFCENKILSSDQDPLTYLITVLFS